MSSSNSEKTISNILKIDATIHANDFHYRTYSGNAVFLWPPAGDPANQFCIRDIANNLAKTTYFPESVGAPFTAAQYAVELVQILKRDTPLQQLHAFLNNASVAYAGHVSTIARQAERHVSPPAQFSDRRDELMDSLKRRIHEGLGIPSLGSDIHDAAFRSGLSIATIKLDATLERDIGASVYPPRSEMNQSMQLLTEPLPRSLKPLIWLKAMESYLRTYEQLAAQCGCLKRN